MVTPAGDICYKGSHLILYSKLLIFVGIQSFDTLFPNNHYYVDFNQQRNCQHLCKLLQRVTLVERPLREVLGQLFILRKWEKAVCGNTVYLEVSDDEAVQSGDGSCF